MNSASKTLCLLLAVGLSPSARAEAGEEILKVKKSTFVNLVDLLVQRGVIDQKEGQGLVGAAQQEAGEIAQDEALGEALQAASGKKPAAKVKHVGYVPEFVKKEIRDQVRAELKDEVIAGVKKDAKSEGWGIPAALPEWVAAIHPDFDIRIRFADEFYGKENEGGILNSGLSGDGDFIGPYNWMNINRAANTPQAGLLRQVGMNPNQAILNNQTDRLRIRERFRLGFHGELADGLQAGVRLATSNIASPVSNDQSLGNTGQSFDFVIDRAYLKYDYLDGQGSSWFTAYAGRFLNPFVSTDVVFDPDLSFQGVAGSFRLPFNRGSGKFAGYKTPNPTARFGINQGQQSPDSVFMTLGVFPIQEVDISVNDKWLYAGQLGADWLAFGQSRFNIAASYYEYKNVNARRNKFGSYANDWTAPQFVQKGNSMVAITDANTWLGQDQRCDDAVGCLFGLASEFKVFNATASFDYAGFDPVHVMLTADYAKNMAFDRQRILREFDGAFASTDLRDRTNAYQVRLDVGDAEIRRWGQWSVNLAYRYVQRDAVLDAFTDSQFHQGGTDARGWALGAQYGLNRHAWLNMRWFSTDSIDGPRYSIDTINVDLNAQF
ncbi:putative porin [Methylomonas sp. SURF-2]|uniref:Porin n=1 Tax=Methylomonas subterranea TaxID=2952225 RepID=A0ABT1TJW4_9GAMM|nr:putative porin [Methylomonas sp. SURF-2]MCQ8105764.1 putative porin [Methylomonas sp. SURF-2]